LKIAFHFYAVLIMKSSEEYLSSRLIVYFMPSSRQLAAIMFTDIVGYTTLMGNDWLVPWIQCMGIGECDMAAFYVSYDIYAVR